MRLLSRPDLIRSLGCSVPRRLDVPYPEIRLARRGGSDSGSYLLSAAALCCCADGSKGRRWLLAHIHFITQERGDHNGLPPRSA